MIRSEHFRHIARLTAALPSSLGSLIQVMNAVAGNRQQAQVIDPLCGAGRVLCNPLLGALAHLGGCEPTALGIEYARFPVVVKRNLDNLPEIAQTIQVDEEKARDAACKCGVLYARAGRDPAPSAPFYRPSVAQPGHTYRDQTRRSQAVAHLTAGN